MTADDDNDDERHYERSDLSLRGEAETILQYCLTTSIFL